MSNKTNFGACLAVLFAATSVLTAAENTATRSTAKDTVHRASTIAGMTVKNVKGDELGHVEDAVIDVRAGKVQYLALSHGGLLGVNDKLFAVPVDAFQLHQGDEQDEYYLSVQIDKDTLQNAPGFDQDKWPNFADNAWKTKIDKHYRKYRGVETSDRADIDVKVGNTRVGVDLDRADREKNRDDRAKDRAKGRNGDLIHRASKISGMTVKNPDNKVLGSVEDVVIDLRNGKVRYLAVSYGGVLGIGDKLFAVPYNAFDCRPSDEEDEYFLVVNIDKQTLESAPGFDDDEWPNFADKRWSDKNDRHYQKPDRQAERDREGKRDR